LASSSSACSRAAGRCAGDAAVVETERVLASVIEAVIGACYLTAGYERTAAAVVEAFAEQIEEALEHPVDFKSALQEQLAQRGEVVHYEVVEELGPPHDRVFTVEARRADVTLARGSGRSKKHAEQDAARIALEQAGWAHAAERAPGASRGRGGR
jgi:ribonuclease-3